MRVALIDGDVIVYKAAWAAEQGIEWADGVHTLHVERSTLVEIADEVLHSITSALKPDKLIVCLSAPGRLFRQDLYEDYKGSRKAARKPIAYKAARALLEDEHGAIWRPRLEADDVMGILATGHTQLAQRTDERIVCSVDKDMRQIPGLHFDWTKDTEQRKVSVVDADLFFWQQVLSGDSTDGVPGLPGVGPKKALKILEPFIGTYPAWPDSIWDHVLDEYEKRGFDEGYALLMARLVRILQASDYDFKKREVKLWSPA